MRIELGDDSITVFRESTDRYRKSGWGRPETTLFTHIRRALLALGYEAIHKRMWKDGHMVDEMQTYVRFRTPKGFAGWTAKGPWLCIFNESWAIYDAGERLMEDGILKFKIVDLGTASRPSKLPKKKPDTAELQAMRRVGRNVCF